VNLRRKITRQLRNSRKGLGKFTRLAALALVLVAWGIWLRPELAGGNVDYVIVGGRSMLPTLRGGDLVVVKERATYRPGDVVAYHIPEGVFRGRRIIHRITGGDPVDGFVLRGDNNAEDDLWHPRYAHIEGKLWKRVPAAGWLVALARAPAVLAAVAGGFVFALVMTWERGPDGRPQRRGVLRPATGAADGPAPSEP
jgi:signal peptidase I